MSRADAIDPHRLDVFIEYERLRLTTAGELLVGCGQLGDAAVNTYSRVHGVSFDRPPALLIESAQTGNSIKFVFSESWLPRVSTDKDHDIIVGVPRKLGIPVFCGFLLLSSAKLVLDVENAYLDAQIKRVELQLKKTELQKSLEKMPDGLKPTEQSIDTVRRIVNDPDLKRFEIYGTDILAYRKRNGDQNPDHR
jgi:hypothetical protein